MPEGVPFDQPPARAVVGRRTRSQVEVSEIPQGTTGQVIRADPVGSGYPFAIQWELPEHRTRPLVAGRLSGNASPGRNA